MEVKLVSQWLFLWFLSSFVKDLSQLQTLYKFSSLILFISLPLLPLYFYSSLNLLSFTSLRTFYNVLPRPHFIVWLLFLRRVDCHAILKGKAAVKFPFVMHNFSF